MSALEQTAATEPGLRDRLREVLPSWTHWSGSIFGGSMATWTTTDGTWSIGDGGMPPWPRLEGPGGKWSFGRKDADHIIGVLRALGAIVEHNPETPSPDAGGEVTASLGCVVVADGGADPVPVAGTGSADPAFCRHCGHACNHTPRHELVDGPGGPMCKDAESCKARRAWVTA